MTVLVVTAIGCGDAERTRRIDAWMTCDECSPQVRSDVAAIGWKAIRPLADLLIAPPPRRLENAHRMIIESYQPVPGLTQDQYVSMTLASYVARNQVRAATSLGDIGTPAARAELQRALDQATTRAYRSDVVRHIAGALARARHQEFGGSLRPTDVTFGDTVRVHAGSLAWGGNESIEIHGSPFGKEVFLKRFMTPGSDDSLEFVAVGENGRYTIAVTGLGSSNITQFDTTLVIRSLRYAVHTPTGAEVIEQSTLPQTRYLLLGAAPADTVDYFRVSSATGATVTATVKWLGLNDLHLAWRGCGVSFPAGGSSIGGTIVGAPTEPVAVARVAILGANLFATTTPTGAFLIAGIPPGAVSGGLVTLIVSRIGYHPRTVRLPVGTTGHVITVARATSTAATTILSVSSVTAVPPGGCRLLQMWTAPKERRKIVQLRLTQ